MDEWYGVLCCPQSHPRLRCADTEACNAAHAEADECVDEAGNVWGAVISRAGSISYGLRHDDISPVRDDEGGAEDAAARRLQGDGVVGHDAPPARRALAPAPSALALTLGERACGRIDPTVGEPATCVVVGLRLGDNNLEGTLAFGAMAGDANGEAADGLCALTHLQLLSVAGEGNRLHGGLPTANGGDAHEAGCLASLRVLDISQNHIGGLLPRWAAHDGSSPIHRLDLHTNALAYEDDLPWMVRCFEHDLSCTGVPPMSCRAFGPEWEVEAHVGRTCVQCSLRHPWPLIVLLSVLTAFVLLGATYAGVLVYRPQHLKHFSSTIAIFVAHLQTLTILATLRLAWPQSARTAVSFLVINGLQLEATRPECLFSSPNGTEDPDAEMPYESYT